MPSRLTNTSTARPGRLRTTIDAARREFDRVSAPSERAWTGRAELQDDRAVSTPSLDEALVRRITRYRRSPSRD